MSYLIFIIKSAFFNFSRSKGRTFLTSLGILIGVMAVVLLMAFGLGLKRYIEGQFESLGANLIYVLPGSKKALARGGGLIGGIKFDEKDVLKLKKIKSIIAITGAYANPATILDVKGKSEIAELVGANEQVVEIFNLELEKGRLLQKKDNDKKSKVIMLSTELAKKFFDFDNDEVIGENIKVNNQNFKIIGLLKSKGGGGFGGGGLDNHIYAPYKSTYIFNPEKNYYGIYLKTETKEQIEETKKQVEEILQKRYDKDDFSVYEQKEIMETIGSIIGIVNSILIAIAAISLVVGGIGIMNIMYVTVTERIREIGIRRAVGARQKDILSQFLTESVILSLFGGILGLGLSFLIVYFIQPFFPAYISIGSIVLALGVSSLIGIVFGVFPAKKAADLSPIDAIRYE